MARFGFERAFLMARRMRPCRFFLSHPTLGFVRRAPICKAHAGPAFGREGWVLFDLRVWRNWQTHQI